MAAECCAVHLYLGEYNKLFSNDVISPLVRDLHFCHMSTVPSQSITVLFCQNYFGGSLF